MKRFVQLTLIGATTGLAAVPSCGVDETVLRELAIADAALVPDDAADVAIPADAADAADAPVDAPADIIVPTSNVYDIVLGQAFSCALMGGNPYCWGDNSQGALATTDNDNRDTPVPIVGNLVFDMLAAGQFHACGLERDTGRVLCWGYGFYGQIGQGDTTTHFSPVPVTLPGPARTIGVGYNHSCAILRTGELYCWGFNSEGQLGQGDFTPPGDAGPDDPDFQRDSPVRVGTDSDWIAISGGQGHTCGLRQSSPGGMLWCWGRNSTGQLGLGPGQPEQIRQPMQVGTVGDWKSIDLGQHTACGIAMDGSLRCWGGGGDSLLDGTRNTLDAPTTIGIYKDWLKIDLDAFSNCGIATGNVLRCWGRNAEGQLGLGDVEERPVPWVVPGAWSSVSVGRFHICAMAPDHSISCTGADDSGELGVGDIQRRMVFTKVLMPTIGVH